MNEPGGPESTYEDYLRTHPDGSFSEWVRWRAGPLWGRMIGHRFVMDMAGDTMPPDVLRRYLIYEHGFVETAVTIFGYALVRAPSIVEQARLTEVLRGLTSEQLEYFDRVFDQLGVTEPMRKARVIPAAVHAFRDGMLSLAAHRSYEEIVGGMTAAEWMYHTWCEDAHARRPADPVVAEWVALHVAAPFAEQVAWMRGQIDDRGPTLSRSQQERVALAFGRTLALEIDFHHAPYEDQGQDGDPETGGG